MYQDEKVKTTNFDKLVQDVKELREFFKVEVRAKEEQILVLNKEVADTDLKASTVTQWIQELKNTFVNELTILSKDNVALKVNCGVLTERLKVLEDVEKQL